MKRAWLAGGLTIGCGTPAPSPPASRLEPEPIEQHRDEPPPPATPALLDDMQLYSTLQVFPGDLVEHAVAAPRVFATLPREPDQAAYPSDAETWDFQMWSTRVLAHAGTRDVSAERATLVTAGGTCLAR